MRGGARCSASLRQLRLSRPLADGGRYARALRTSAAPHALRSLPYCRTQRPELAIQGASLSTSCPNRSRSMATVVDADPIVHDGGPIPEYDRRVEVGKLRNDEHQRGEDFDGTTVRHWLTEEKALFRIFRISTGNCAIITLRPSSTRASNLSSLHPRSLYSRRSLARVQASPPLEISPTTFLEACICTAMSDAARPC